MATRADIRKYKDMRYALVRTSVDDVNSAKDMAGQALDLGLAASVHIRPVDSLYIWNGEACDHPEYEVEFMTTVPCSDDLVSFILKHHPYECAEIIKTGFQSLSDDFTVWLNECCQSDTR